MARSLLPAVAVVAASLLSAGATPAPLTTHAARANGVITVVKVRPPTGDGVFFVAPSGGAGRWLAGGGALDPSWSPNGKTLLFTRKQETELWLADQQGSHEERIATGSFDEFNDEDWSPDGSHVVLITARGISMAELVGRRLEPFRRVIGDPSADAAALSPAAPQLAFRSGSKLLLANTDGSDEHVLASGFRVSAPSFAPDGTTIAFTRCVYQRPAWLSLVDPDGANLRDVAQLPRNSCSDPTWSPDGSELAFPACQKGEPGRLEIVDRDGSNLRDVAQLSAADACPGHVVWSPDGTLIAFANGNGYQRYALEVAAADGSSQRVIARGIDGCCRISWQRLGA